MVENKKLSAWNIIFFVFVFFVTLPASFLLIVVAEGHMDYRSKWFNIPAISVLFWVHLFFCFP